MNTPSGDLIPHATDPVKRMIEIVASGMHCRILYDKGPTAIARTIEPRRLVDGLSGLLVRALQISPERGFRTFKITCIVSVEPDTLPLSDVQKRENTFATGEVVAFGRSTSEGVRKPNASRTAAGKRQTQASERGLWSAAWFTEYVACVRDAVLDLKINEQELKGILALQQKLNLRREQWVAAHTQILAEELITFAADGRVEAEEEEFIRCLVDCLETAGGIPVF